VIAGWEVGLTLVIIVGDQVFAIRSMRDTERMHANLNGRSGWRDFSSLGQDSRVPTSELISSAKTAPRSSKPLQQPLLHCRRPAL